MPELMSETPRYYADEINAAPQSHHVRSFLCDSCNHVHVVFFDADDHVIAHATISDKILQDMVELHLAAKMRIL